MGTPPRPRFGPARAGGCWRHRWRARMSAADDGLVREGEFRWVLSRRDTMRVPGIVFASERLPAAVGIARSHRWRTWPPCPGSMGTAPYVLVGEAGNEAFASTCHGAGRAMSRHATMRTVTGSERLSRLREQGVAVAARAPGPCPRKPRRPTRTPTRRFGSAPGRACPGWWRGCGRSGCSRVGRRLGRVRRRHSIALRAATALSAAALTIRRRAPCRMSPAA